MNKMLKKDTFNYPGLDIPYELKEIRGKNVSITVYPNNRVVVRHPRRVSKSFLQNFMEERKTWVWDQYKKNKANNPQKTNFKNGEILPIFGQNRKIKWFEEKESKLIDTEIIFSSKGFRSQKGKENKAKSFLKQILLEEITPIVDKTASKLNTKKYTVKVRTMKSLWGSCSPDNDLTFNLGLVHCPDFVIKYVVIHEVSHTKEHNHSNKFWEIVNKLDPEYVKAEKWIKTNGPKMLCYLN